MKSPTQLVWFLVLQCCHLQHATMPCGHEGMPCLCSIKQQRAAVATYRLIWHGIND